MERIRAFLINFLSFVKSSLSFLLAGEGEADRNFVMIPYQASSIPIIQKSPVMRQAMDKEREAASLEDMEGLQIRKEGWRLTDLSLELVQ